MCTQRCLSLKYIHKIYFICEYSCNTYKVLSICVYIYDIKSLAVYQNRIFNELSTVGEFI